MTIMFLQYIDDDQYEKAVDSTAQKAENYFVGSLTILLKLPGIAAIISQDNTVKDTTLMILYYTNQ